MKLNNLKEASIKRNYLLLGVSYVNVEDNDSIFVIRR